MVLCDFLIIKSHFAPHNVVWCGSLPFAVWCSYFILPEILVGLGAVKQFERFSEHP